MNRIAFQIALASLLSMPAAVAAHDFFLLPERFVSADAAELTLHATVSAGFPALEIVVDAERIGWLGAAGNGAPALRVGEPASHAATLVLSAPAPGLVVAGASTRAREVDYAADVIDVILQEYRVGADARAAVDALAAPRTLRASSTRFAKTLLCVLECGDRAAASRPLGIAFEFVAVPGSDAQFTLLRDGGALAGYPVDLVTGDGVRSHLATDEAGRIELPATARGAMMLFAAFLQPPPDGGRFDLQLTSLTLERR
jgi:hypothetical protein